MERSKSLTIAAVLTATLGVFGIIDATRILAAGSEGLPPLEGMESAGGPPFAAGIVFIVLGVAALFAAFGLWKNQRWGRVVATATAAVFGLFSLGDVMGGTIAGRLDLAFVSVLIVAACVSVIFLVLRRQEQPVNA